MDNKVNQVVRAFRYNVNNLDKDVIKSILEMFQGNVDETIAFLQLNQEDDNETYYDPNKMNEEGANLPQGYMDLPVNWKNPDELEHIKKLVLKVSDEGKLIERIKKCLLNINQPNINDHVEFFSDPKKLPYYFAVVLLLIQNKVELPSGTKSQILATAWAMHQFEFATYLVYHTNQFSLPEILKAVKILDAQRLVRQKEKKLNALLKFKENGSVVRKKKLMKLQDEIHNAKKEGFDESILKTSFTGALSRRIKLWVTEIPESKLLFFALHMSKKHWKELADLCHFAPYDFQLTEFLDIAFGKKPKEGGLVDAFDKLAHTNAEELLSKRHMNYAYLRKHLNPVSNNIKLIVANKDPLDEVLWWYHEIAEGATKKAVDQIIKTRINNGEKVTLPYGKLMERLLYFKDHESSFYNDLIPIAEEQLKKMALPLETPIKIFGDASFSMDVAIRTATIIASVVTALTEANLSFFNTTLVSPTVQPKNVTDVIDVAQSTKASGLTAPSVTLKKLLDDRTPVKIFLMVTDEIENEPHDGTFFAQQFYRYYCEVYPAKLVMVSFLEDVKKTEKKGRMVSALHQMGIRPIEFRMNATRPDLSKLDKLLGILSSETSAFEDLVSSAVAKYEGTFSSIISLFHTDYSPKVFKKQQRPPKKTVNPPVNKNTIAEHQFRDRFDNLPQGIKSALLKLYACPLTKLIIFDPVKAADGETYERAALTKWFSTHQTSPTTGKVIPKDVTDNLLVKEDILNSFEKTESILKMSQH